MADDPKQVSQDLTSEDRALLGETLTIGYEEPKQVKVLPEKPSTIVAAVTTPQERVQETINKFENLIALAEELKKLVGKKIETRRVQVPASKNPMVRDAIRRMFGIDSDTVTYEMFMKALATRADLVKEGNQDYVTKSS